MTRSNCYNGFATFPSMSPWITSMRKVCPHCGESIPDTGDAFCPECRQPLDDAVLGHPSSAVASTPESMEVDSSHSEQMKPRSLRTSLFLFGFYGLSVIAAVRDIYYWRKSILDLVIPVAMAIVLGWWAISDANSRRQPIPKLSRPWFFLFAGLVVPIYMIFTRGAKGLALVLLHLAAWIALYVGVSMIGEAILL